MENKRQIELLKVIKDKAGLHSPSIKEIVDGLGYNPIKHDFCFLSNPYATDIVVDYLTNFFSFKENVFTLLESYPANYTYVAKNIANFEGLATDYLVVANGAIQAIEWACEGWGLENLLIPIPTFSSYYEFLLGRYTFTSDFWLSGNLSADLLIEIADKNNCDSILLIFPNNPSGEVISIFELNRLISFLGDKKLIIDESFSHFLDNYEDYKILRNTIVNKNVTFIKSMSKDFGVAGLRLGYLYSFDQNLLEFSKKKTTWNLNNFSVWFSDLLIDGIFKEKYQLARQKFFSVRDSFFTNLNCIEGISVFPSQSNFFLIKYDQTMHPDLVYEMLINEGIYLRTMSDKVGLDGSYFRVAVRKEEENNFFLESLKNYVK